MSWVAGGSVIVFSRAAVNLLEKYSGRFPTKFVAHDVWLRNLMTLEGSFEVKRIHIPRFHQLGGGELWKRFDRASNSLISVHLNRDMHLIDRYHRLT